MNQGNFGFDGSYSHDEKVDISTRLAQLQMQGGGPLAEVYLNPLGQWELEVVHTESQRMYRLCAACREASGKRKHVAVVAYAETLQRLQKMDEMNEPLSPLQEQIEDLNESIAGETDICRRLDEEPSIPNCPAHRITEVRKYKPIFNGTFTLTQPDVLLQVYKPILKAVLPNEALDEYVPHYEVTWPSRPSYVVVEVKSVMRPEHDISQVYKFFEFCPKPVRVMVCLEERTWEYRHDFEDAGAECFIFDPAWAGLIQ